MAVDWDDDPLEPDSLEEPSAQPRDPVIDRAKSELRAFVLSQPAKVFYQRQLQVIFEGRFFHWITSRALSELAAEGTLRSESLTLPQSETLSGRIVIYRSPRHRYWRRGAREIIRLVSRFSKPEFTWALGTQGELMFDAGLPTVGFMPQGSSLRSYKGLEWTETSHDLDRVYERDGIAYGAEIKNTLGYIEKDELEVKVKMCKALGLRPLFIVRMAPKSYVNFVAEEGGFTLIFKYQLYPFGQKAFADEIREKLGLPTDSPARIADGTLKRFLDWHIRTLG